MASQFESRFTNYATSKSQTSVDPNSTNARGTFLNPGTTTTPPPTTPTYNGWADARFGANAAAAGAEQSLKDIADQYEKARENEAAAAQDARDLISMQMENIEQQKAIADRRQRALNDEQRYLMHQKEINTFKSLRDMIGPNMGSIQNRLADTAGLEFDQTDQQVLAGLKTGLNENFQKEAEDLNKNIMNWNENYNTLAAMYADSSLNEEAAVKNVLSQLISQLGGYSYSGSGNDWIDSNGKPTAKFWQTFAPYISQGTNGENWQVPQSMFQNIPNREDILSNRKSLVIPGMVVNVRSPNDTNSYMNRTNKNQSRVPSGQSYNNAYWAGR